MQGILRGFDPFMNLVVDDTLEMGPGGQQNTIGMVVSIHLLSSFLKEKDSLKKKKVNKSHEKTKQAMCWCILILRHPHSVFG